MKFRLLLILLLSVLTLSVKGQNTPVQGEVSFITSNNIYVKFKSTTDINPGDTLAIDSIKKACLVVNSKSSISVVCSAVKDCPVKVKDIINFYPSNSALQKRGEDITLDQEQVLPSRKDTLLTNLKVEQNSGNIKGRILFYF